MNRDKNKPRKKPSQEEGKKARKIPSKNSQLNSSDRGGDSKTLNSISNSDKSIKRKVKKIKLTNPGRLQAQAFVNATCRKGVDGIRLEFRSRVRGNNPVETQAFIANQAMGKNRYKDVGCLDANRVILKQWSTDYIHANYVGVPGNERRFICTQGPKDDTAGDFWHMIWQEKVKSIIMLCNVVEKGAKKCAEYFPTAENTTKQYTPYICKWKTEKPLVLKGIDGADAFVLIRTISVTKGSAMITVNQYHWMDWPDRGVPKPDLSIVRLLDTVRADTTPIVVHCSAGIGRTGSVVMIEYAREALNDGHLPEHFDGILDRIRSQRGSSVQTDMQYIYVHLIMVELMKAHSIGGPPTMDKFLVDAAKSLIIEATVPSEIPPKYRKK